MKISQFTIATEQDDDRNNFLLYNTHTTAFVVLRKDIYIDADGTLYKCHRLSGRKQYACGTVFDGIDTNNDYYKIFRNPIIEDEECKKCSILPICQGGCKSQRILYGNKQKCHRIKQIQGKLVNLYYKEVCKK